MIHFSLLGVLGAALFAQVALAKTALVYRGPGSCDEGCSDAAALTAEMAGFTPVFVGPTETDPKLFEDAAVWVQPGGTSRQVGRAMSRELKGRIREFVRGGGAYVGFCAGGFYATAQIGDLADAGLGLIAGRSRLYKEVDDSAQMITFGAGGSFRSLYWEGGPAFYPPVGGAGMEIMSTYPNGAAASVRAQFGEGRVYVHGAHPEAPPQWREYFQLNDVDGLDYSIAVDMIRWATRNP